MVEHISNPKLLGAKTLFATHYHELTELEGKLDSVNNYCIAVREQGDDIIFLRKIIRGGADKSYGIQVARLAGVPDSVIARSKEIASWLSETDVTEKAHNLQVRTSVKEKQQTKEKEDKAEDKQISLFDLYPDDHPVLKELAALDVSNMTPIQALNTLYELQKKLKNTN